MDSSLARSFWSVNQEVHRLEKALVVMCPVLPGGSFDGSALVAAHSFGQWNTGGLSMLWSLTVWLIRASGKGQMCQGLLGLALFSPPGFQHRCIQLRYNNLTPLKPLDPLAWQPLLCFIFLRISNAIKNYSQQHLNCSFIHFGLVPLPTPFNLLYPSLSYVGFNVHFVVTLLSYQFFFYILSHWIKSCFSVPACYDFKDSSLHLALSILGASVGLTDTPALKLMAASSHLPWGAHLGKKNHPTPSSSIIVVLSPPTEWNHGHEKRDCLTIQAYMRANENM